MFGTFRPCAERRMTDRTGQLWWMWPNYLEWHHRFSHYGWSKQVDGRSFASKKCCKPASIWREKHRCRWRVSAYTCTVEAMEKISMYCEKWAEWELSCLPCNLFNLLQINKQPLQYRYIVQSWKSGAILQVQGSRSERVGNPGSVDRTCCQEVDDVLGSACFGAFIEVEKWWKWMIGMEKTC